MSILYQIGCRWKDRSRRQLFEKCLLVLESCRVRSTRALKIGPGGVLSCVTYGKRGEDNTHPLTGFQSSGTSQQQENQSRKGAGVERHPPCLELSVNGRSVYESHIIPIAAKPSSEAWSSGFLYCMKIHTARPQTPPLVMILWIESADHAT